MVPDIEREWIAEEIRNTPQPGRWAILIVLLLLGIAGLLYECLG
jgi:hypothetical protein